MFKYRAWIKEAEKMVDVQAIDFDWESIYVKNNTDDDLSFEYPFDEVILMQSTGLMSNKNELIYEDDIVFIHHKYRLPDEGREPSIVDMLEGLRMKGIKENCKGLGIEVKLLGNIYEHPDLIRSLENE